MTIRPTDRPIKSRKGHSKHMREQSMVQALQNLFEQLHEQEDYFGRTVRAYIEAEVRFTDAFISFIPIYPLNE